MTTKQTIEPQLQPATKDDLGLIQQWLQQNHLPSSDIPTRLDAIFLYRLGSEVMGLGGIEQYDSYGLLRSVVVAAPFRGKGMVRGSADNYLNRPVSREFGNCIC